MSAVKVAVTTHTDVSAVDGDDFALKDGMLIVIKDGEFAAAFAPGAWLSAEKVAAQ